MSLLIGIFLIYHHKLPWWWYPIAALVAFIEWDVIYGTVLTGRIGKALVKLYEMLEADEKSRINTASEEQRKLNERLVEIEGLLRKSAQRLAELESKHGESLMIIQRIQREGRESSYSLEKKVNGISEEQKYIYKAASDGLKVVQKIERTM